MMNDNNSGGAFPQSQPVDRSASGLQYQSYQLSARARGAALGQGLRVAPTPNDLFTKPLSGGQFGSGHAKSTVGDFTSPPTTTSKSETL